MAIQSDRRTRRRDEQRLRLHQHRPARPRSSAACCSRPGRWGRPWRSSSSRVLLAFWCLGGLYMLQPNQAALLLLFGSYRGTDRERGLRWANPFYSKTKISVRARNFNSEKLKVNDLRGNPIEIAATVVWRVDDTAQGELRRRELRGLRADAGRVGAAPPRPQLRLRQPRGAGRDRASRGDAALGHRGGLGGTAPRAAAALRPGRASSSSTPSSPTSPTRPRSPARCCAASRPRR